MLPELGAVRVLLHDPTGSLQPHRAEELVGALAEASGLPVGIYVQGAGGSALAATLAAARARRAADRLRDLPARAHAAPRLRRGARPRRSPAWGSTPASTSRRSGRRRDLVDEHIGDEPVAPLSPRIAVRAAQHDVPAGLVAGVDSTLRAQDAGDRLEEVLEELDADPRRGRLAAARRADRPGARVAGAAERPLREPLPDRRRRAARARLRPLRHAARPDRPGRAARRRADARPGDRGGRRSAAQRAARAGRGHGGQRGGAAPARPLRRGRRAPAARRSAAARAATRTSLAAVDKARAERIRELVRIVAGVGRSARSRSRRTGCASPCARRPTRRPASASGAPLALPEPAPAPLQRADAERHRPRRVADGRHLLPRAAAGRAAVRRGGRRRRGRADALHPRGDEADERGEGRGRGGRPPRSTSRTRQPVEFGQLLFDLEPLVGRPLDAV